MVKNENDWHLCEYRENLRKLGFQTFLSIEFEEDSPLVVDDKNIKLGSFCTDSSVVAIVLLDELLTYNSEFNQHNEYLDNWIVIKDFDGIINSKIKLKLVS